MRAARLCTTAEPVSRLRSTVYDILSFAGFFAAHPLRPPQLAQEGQEAQSQPQEDLPAFLFRSMRRSASPTMRTRTATTAMFARLADTQVSIQNTLLYREPV